MNAIVFTPAQGSNTEFQRDGDRIRLSRLFGMACNLTEQASPAPRLQGLALVSTSMGRFEGDQFTAREISIVENRLRIVWAMAGGAHDLQSVWDFCPTTGIWSRKDRFINRSDKPLTLFRCLARYAFAPGRYDAYFQESRWSHENQGCWEPMRAGARVLGCEWGRTTHNGTPYVCLRERDTMQGVAFHIIPQGNWLIRLRSDNGCGQDWPCAVVELGQADEDLRLTLAPGEGWNLPEILVQELPGGEPQRAAPCLHRYLNRRIQPLVKPHLPVVYNTWFDQFSTLDVPRLREQLRVVKEIGCEVFVIDAGWFGVGGSGWGTIGDWREDTARSFGGHMREFADEVRAAGLGFGLWLEPERCDPKAPVFNQHPEWFRGRHLALEIPAAYAWLCGEFARLIETYQLAWIKIDMNVPSGYDPTGAELYHYYAAWHKLLDEIRQRYPATVIENCASGGMRQDISACFHYDCHFISDTAHPVDVLRISQGAWLRLPPGRLARWLVLRSVGQTIPHFDTPASQSDPSIVTPGGATWIRSEKIPLDFAVQAALPGVLGFGGDYILFTSAEIRRLRWYVDFHKKWRPMLANATGYLLTPPALLEERGGWLGFQMQSQDGSDSLVFIYHLSDGCARKRFRLCNLNPDRQYSVRRESPDGHSEQPAMGQVLMNEGLDVELDGGFHAQPLACIFVVHPVNA